MYYIQYIIYMYICIYLLYIYIYIYIYILELHILTYTLTATNYENPTCNCFYWQKIKSSYHVKSSNGKETITTNEKAMMIFKQTLTKIFVTKKQLLVLIKLIPFYKLMLVIMALLQKTHGNTKIKITITKK